MGIGIRRRVTALCIGVSLLVALALTLGRAPAGAAVGREGSGIVKLDRATFHGKDGTFTITGVEVQQDNAPVQRLDVVCSVVVAADGALKFEDVKVKPSVAAAAQGFTPGRYKSADERIIMDVDGPSPAEDGRELWTALSRGEDTIWQSAAWSTGPLKGHPQLGTWEHLETLPATFTYGSIEHSHWSNSLQPLIAVRQAGKSITFTVFTLNNSTDGPVYRQNRVVVLRRAD